jgi:FAD/FMN-containing dehydrogenase
MTKIPADPSFRIKSLPPEITSKLQKEVKGQVMVDSASRGRYATDASIYQQFPLAVLVPESAEDIEAGLAIAKESGIPVLARGGGTSQCGQTTGAALVIDNSKFFRNILSSDLADAEKATI